MRSSSRCSIGPQRSMASFAVMAMLVFAIVISPTCAEIHAQQSQSADAQASESPLAILEVQIDAETGSSQVVPASVEIATGELSDDADADDAARIAKATATHHQTGAIDANVAGQRKVSLKCFCLTADDQILAGCVGSSGEIRVFDSDGGYLTTWSAPFQPDAIFARADGAVFLAGEGKLAKLTADGEVEFECESPHAAAMGANRDAIRKQVIAQAKQRVQMFARQTENYDKMLQQADKQLAEIKKQIAKLDQAASAAAERDGDDEPNESVGPTADRRVAMKKQMLERRLEMQERMKQQYEQAKEQWVSMAEQNKQPELTEEQIEQQIESSIQYKLKASSISAMGAEVFLATHAAVGYGFEVWRMDDQFAGGEKIITGLSGCCGQMDVKANDEGLFVAENSRHRVCHYDRDGKLIGNWGQGARKGLVGFGSCCNPMNVAFGPGGAVYTSEDDTGRIKRYSSDGELLGLVGAVDLAPGCKNVSIAVNSDGSRVYMMDISRNRVLRMEPYGPDEAPAPVPYDDTAQAGSAVRYEQNGSADAGGALVNSLKSIFGLKK